MIPVVLAVVQWPVWAGFLAFVAAMLALDLGVFHRKAHAISLREAAVWSAVWIGLAGVFAAGVFWFGGPRLGMEFTTGYLIEKALSIDNIFVMVILFGAFGVPAHQQHGATPGELESQFAEVLPRHPFARPVGRREVKARAEVLKAVGHGDGLP